MPFIRCFACPGLARLVDSKRAHSAGVNQSFGTLAVNGCTGGLWQDRRETEVSELGQLFIVARSNTELYDLLTEELSGARKIRVILDRRRDGRQRPGLSTAERRPFVLPEDCGGGLID